MKYARQLALTVLLSLTIFDSSAAEAPTTSVENRAGAAAQETTDSTTDKTTPLADQRFSIHGQMTSFTQSKAAFSAPYSGANSLPAYTDSAGTFDAGLFIGMKLWTGAEA